MNFSFWAFLLSVMLMIPMLGNAQVRSCSKKDLQLQNCHIRLGPFPLHIRHDKILLRGPIEREMKTFQMAKFEQWDVVRGHYLNQRAFLEVVLWGESVGEFEVSSAHFYIYEVQRGSILPRLEKVIQKRKKINDDGFEKDRRLPTKIYAKGKKILWQVGDESGEL